MSNTIESNLADSIKNQLRKEKLNSAPEFINKYIVDDSEISKAKEKAGKFLEKFSDKYTYKGLASEAGDTMEPFDDFDGEDNITFKASSIVDIFSKYSVYDDNIQAELNRFRISSSLPTLFKKFISGITKLNMKSVGRIIWCNMHISQFKLICKVFQYQYFHLLKDIGYKLMKKWDETTINEFNDYIITEMMDKPDYDYIYNSGFPDQSSKGKVKIPKRHYTKTTAVVNEEIVKNEEKTVESSTTSSDKECDMKITKTENSIIIEVFAKNNSDYELTISMKKR